MKSFWQKSFGLFAFLALTACGGTSSLTSGDNSNGDSTIDTSVHWEGVEETIVQLGDVDFNLLDGVRAYDHTGDLSVTVLDDDYFSPNYVSTYTITYEAELASGDKVTQERMLQVVKGVNVENGAFEFGKALWRFDIPGGAGTFVVENQQAHIEVTDAGTEAWAVQLYQTGLQFKAGVTYELSFEMKSANNRSIAAGFEDVGNNYSMMLPGYQAVIVPSDWDIYSALCTPTADVGNVKAVIYLGQGLEVDATASPSNPLEIDIDNIRVREYTVAEVLKAPVFAHAENATVTSRTEFLALEAVTATDYLGNDISSSIEIVGEVPNSVNAQTGMLVSYRVEDSEGNFGYVNRRIAFVLDREHPYNLINADFDNGFQGWIKDVNQTNGDGAASFTANIDGTIDIDITNPSTANWHIQFYQTGVQLTQNAVYRTTLVIKASVARKLDIEISNPSTGFSQIATKQVMLGTDYQTFTLEYKAQDNASAKFSLLLGANGANVVTIDQFENQQIDPSEATTIDTRDYEPYEVINGDFNFGLYNWTGEATNGAEVNYSQDLTNGLVVAEVVTSSPEEIDWHSQISQSGRHFTSGTTYSITLTASASIAVSVALEVTNSNGATTLLKETVNLTTVEAAYSFTFVAADNYDAGKIAILLGTTAPSTVTFNSLIIATVI
ncbi:MAG: carbohydrate binding domain-containing protein [Bacilli bacterium]|jgi:hypothetical protein